MPPMTLRPLTEHVLDGVLAVQAAFYPGPMPEAAAGVLGGLGSCDAAAQQARGQAEGRQMFLFTHGVSLV